MSENEFWTIADNFRDPRVWYIKNGQWWKDNIWGTPSPYGDVYLNKTKIEEFNERQKSIFNKDTA